MENIFVAVCFMAPLSAHPFAFSGDQRGGAGGLPIPKHWNVPIVAGGRTLNVTFNTAPAFAVPVAEQGALKRAVNTWDVKTVLVANNLVNNPLGFPRGTPVKIIAARTYDLESIFLHELGHAWGLGHPNLADRAPAILAYDRATASTPGANGRYELAGNDGLVGNFDDTRGDDLSLHLVDADNNPFNAFAGRVDKATFSMDGPFAAPAAGYAQTSTREVASAGVAKTGFAALANLEAVMVQGAISLEAQRELTYDDLYGIRYLESGVDQTALTADDFVFKFNFVAAGVAVPGRAIPAGTQVLVSKVPGFVGIAETFRRGGKAITEYDMDYTTGTVLSHTDIWLDGDPLDPGSQIVFVDIVVDQTAPEPPYLSIQLSNAVAVVSWNPDLSGYRLEGNPDLQSSGWAEIPQTGTNVAFVPLGDQSQFFRLHRLEADLGVALTADPPSLSIGSNVTYSITVTNPGTNVATGVLLVDPLPAELTFVSATVSQGTYSQTDGVFTCDLGSLDAGATASASIVATTTLSGSITNIVSVSSNEADYSQEDNLGMAPIVVSGPTAQSGVPLRKRSK